MKSKHGSAISQTEGAPATQADMFNILSDHLAQNRKTKTRWGKFFDKAPKKKLGEPAVLQPTVQREPIFSARLGNRSRIEKSSSEESLCLTDISLLSLSIEDLECTKHKKKKKKKGHANTTPPKTVQTAAPTPLSTKISSTSVLGKMMKLGASSGYLANYANGGNSWEEDEEKRKVRVLIINCDKHNVLLTRGKSLSTATLNLKPKPLPHMKIKRPLRRSQSIPAEYEIFSSKGAASMLDVTGIKKTKSKLASRLKYNAITAGRQSMADNARSNTTKIPGKLTKLVHGIMGIDLDKRASERAKRKIKQTVDALDRLTGYGDPQTAGVNFCTDQDKFKYIPEDFSHLPYYPQRVKVAPQLTAVIKEDIGVRMGRPKYHELSEEDVEALEEGYQMDRYHRNLMIFNWLMSLEVDNFENYQDLAIIDPADVEKSRRESERLLRRRVSRSSSVLPILR